MEQSKRTRERLLGQYRQYPQGEIRDLFKYLYQSAFGCEHLVSSPEAAVTYILRESDSLPEAGGEPLVDPLDGAYSRVSLAYRHHGLSAETLGKLFAASAQPEPNGRAALEDKLRIAKALVDENALPFSSEEFEKAVREWQAAGYTPVHHSEAFRRQYHPAYRVIANAYVPFLPLFARIDALLEKGPAVVAVEGGSASGKTTLSERLQAVYDCTVFHMDDFFLRPEQRTAERYAQVGGNVDRERFLEEVLLPLRERRPIHYRRFDCSTLTLSPPTEIRPKKLTVIEGAYAMHPELAAYYDLSAFLEVSPALQRARIEKRNTPQAAGRFFHQWIPLEQRYFSEMRVKERCALVIPIEE